MFQSIIITLWAIRKTQNDQLKNRRTETTRKSGRGRASFLPAEKPGARRFVHDATGARGMVATNADESILVWSSAVGGAATFTNDVGNASVVYDVVLVAVDDDGEEEEEGGGPEIVECAPFAFAALEEVSAGTWRLTLKPGTEFCVYTLMSSGDLVEWTQVGDKKTLSAADLGTELEFTFEAPAAGVKRFWKVEGANGVK